MQYSHARVSASAEIMLGLCLELGLELGLGLWQASHRRPAESYREVFVADDFCDEVSEGKGRRYHG